MADSDELKIDQVAFATVPAGKPWTVERVANPNLWLIKSSFSPVAERYARGEFDFGKLNTHQQRRVLHAWLPISNLLLKRLSIGDDEPVDLVATAVWSNGSRHALVWPSQPGSEPVTPQAFVSPPVGDGAETWHELTDPGVAANLGWALWDRMHPADPELRDAAAGLFHQTHLPQGLPGTDVVDVVPEAFRPAADRDSLLTPSTAAEDRATAEQALERAQNWHRPLTEPSQRELGSGWLEYERGLVGDVPYYAMVLPGAAGSFGSMVSLFATAKEWMHPLARWILEGTLPPGADLTPAAFGAGGMIAGLAVASLPEATQRLKDRFRRGQNRRYLRWARDNLPAAGYSDEVKRDAGERLPLLPEEKVPGPRRSNLRRRLHWPSRGGTSRREKPDPPGQ